MKKLMTFVAALMVAVSSYAQPEAGTVTLQPMVGGNLSNAVGGGMSGDYKFGFVAGAEFGYQTTDKFAVSAGVLYSLQGLNAADDSYAAQHYGSDYKENYGYINIPILANYYVFDGFAVKAGVQPAFSLFATAHAGDDSADLEGLKSFDFSIPVGMSYEYSNVCLDFRYNIGLTKIAEGTDLKNSVFQLTLGYKFAL